MQIGKVIWSALAVFGLVLAFSSTVPSAAASRAELDIEADRTLERLMRSEPVSQDMIDRAAGILVFPEIVKGGFVVGGATGEGVLRVNGRTEGVFRSNSLSIGLQAGIAKYGYVMFLMDEESVRFVRDTKGWEIGVGPSVTIADEGVARRLSTSTVQEGIYVFFVGQEGFFAGAGLEGTKISRIAE